MIRVLLILGCVSMCWMGVHAQSFPIEGQDMLFMMNQSMPMKTDEDIAQAVQAMLIEQLFLKQLLNSDMALFESDEDEDGMMGANKKEREMQNMIMTRILSQEFAKQDLFQLKKYLLKNSGGKVGKSRGVVRREVRSD